MIYVLIAIICLFVGMLIGIVLVSLAASNRDFDERNSKLKKNCKTGIEDLSDQYRHEVPRPYKGKLNDQIYREDAVKALCDFACHRGAFCPDGYCYEVRMVFDDAEAVKGGQDAELDRRDSETSRKT